MRKKWLTCFLSAFMISILPLISQAADISPPTPPPNILEQLARQEKEFRKNIFKSQVKLHTSRLIRGNIWRNGMGTGVIVGRENRGDKTAFYIVSAAHVLMTQSSEALKDTKIVATFPEKNTAFPAVQSGYSAKFLFGAWELEYVFLEAEVPNVELGKLDVAVASVAQGPPERLENHWASGYLHGQFVVANKAYLSRVVFNERGVFDSTPYFILLVLYFIADGSNGPGMSGGGVFTARGELTALIFAVGDGGNILSAAPAFLIQQDFTAKLEALKNTAKGSPNEKK